MGLFTMIGTNLGAMAAKAMEPAIGVVKEVVTDRDLQNELINKLELAYNQKNFELKLAMAQGNWLQRAAEPVKEFVKIFIILCIFVIFPVAEAVSGFHIDIVKYLESLPVIGWIVLVASDLGPTAINKLVDFHAHRATVKYVGKNAN